MIVLARVQKVRKRICVCLHAPQEREHVRVYLRTPKKRRRICEYLHAPQKRERSSKKGNASDCICLLIYALAVSAIFVPVFVIFNKYNIKNTLLFA